MASRRRSPIFSAGGAEAMCRLHIGLMFDTARAWSATCASPGTPRSAFLNTFPKAADFTLVEFSEPCAPRRFNAAGVSAADRAHPWQPREGADGAVRRAQRVLGERVRSDRQEGARHLHRRRRYLELADLERDAAPAARVGCHGVSDRVPDEPGLGALLQQTQLMEIARLTGGRAVFPAR